MRAGILRKPGVPDDDSGDAQRPFRCQYQRFPRSSHPFDYGHLRERRESIARPRPAASSRRFVLVVNTVGSLPGVLSSTDTAWFQSLDKPWFYPPGIAFSVVWTVLFTLLGVALWLVWRSDASGRRLALGLFVVQMALNVAWTPSFFSLEAPLFALGVILALWVLVVATVEAFRRVDRRAAALLVPSLAWVTFAAVLNFEIWRLNA